MIPTIGTARVSPLIQFQSLKGIMGDSNHLLSLHTLVHDAQFQSLKGIMGDSNLAKGQLSGLDMSFNP